MIYMRKRLPRCRGTKRAPYCFYWTISANPHLPPRRGHSRKHAGSRCASGKHMYFPALCVRPAYGGEALYRSARQAGVTFIKYEQLDIVFQEGEGFAVTVFDGDLSHAFTAVSVFADGPAGPIPAYAHALQALRIQADAQGFAAAPFFLAPALTSRRGVYRVGRDAAERLEESLCAILADACAPHPSRHVAEVDGAKCVLCWSCYRACPHAALAPDTAARRMNVLPSACQGCGVCASVCPGGAISLSQDSARKAMGKTLVLCCKNSAEAAARELPPGVGIDIVPLPCGGSADAGMLASALGRYEKVFLAVCRDDACRHFTGNRRACAQAERLVQELVQAGLPVERLGFAKVSHALPGEFRAQLAVFFRRRAMITGRLKETSDILRSLRSYRSIAVAACGTCVTVCMAGGEKEALHVAELIRLSATEEGREVTVTVAAPVRQCDMEFLSQAEDVLDGVDCILSLGCGAGVQFLAEKYPDTPVLPGIDTSFLGVNRELGYWTEMCQGCGSCVLEQTGGVCPVSRCAKSLFNGPCGGSSGGKCEINHQTDCAWQLIYERMKRLGKLDELRTPIEARDWRSARDGGPRKLIRGDVRV